MVLAVFTYFCLKPFINSYFMCSAFTTVIKLVPYRVGTKTNSIYSKKVNIRLEKDSGTEEILTEINSGFQLQEAGGFYPVFIRSDPIWLLSTGFYGMGEF